MCKEKKIDRISQDYVYGEREHKGIWKKATMMVKAIGVVIIWSFTVSDWPGDMK